MLQALAKEFYEALEAERAGVLVEVWRAAVGEGMLGPGVGEELVLHFSRGQLLLQRLLCGRVRESSHLQNQNKTWWSSRVNVCKVKVT